MISLTNFQVDPGCQLQVNHHITKIPFLVLKDKTQFLDYYRRKIEVKENSAIEFVITSLVKLTSKATLARRKAKAAHRQCPFCFDTLMSERCIPKPDKNGYYRIHCYNSKQGRCDFYARHIIGTTKISKL